MSENSTSHQGLVQRLIGNLVGLAHNHLALFSIELEEERDRLLLLAGLGFAGLVFFALSLVLLSIALVWWINPEWRGLAILGLGALYMLITFSCVWLIRRNIARSPVPFSATLHELKKDREQFLS